MAGRYDLDALYRASEEELASARRRVAEADAMVGLAREELRQAEWALGYLFPDGVDPREETG